MTDFEKMETSREKFQKLEKQFRAIIAKCNQKNLVDQKENTVNRYGVENASIIEHYNIDNSLHVYRLLNEEKQPICYWISSTPLYVDYMYGKYKNTKYSGAPAFEYSIGGVGNSLPIDFDKYSALKHISVVVGEEGRHLEKDVMASPGFALSGSLLAKFSDSGYQRDGFDYLNNYGKNQELYNSGDLFEYIKNLKPLYNEDAGILSVLKDTIEKVEQLSLGAIKDEEISSEKKGFLKKLLGKNKQLDSEIDVFSKNNGRTR